MRAGCCRKEEKGVLPAAQNGCCIVQDERIAARLAAIGRLHALPCDAPEAMAAVRALQREITAHFYPCTPPILLGTVRRCLSDGALCRRIGEACGEGAAEFIAGAVAAFCVRCRI